MEKKFYSIFLFAAAAFSVSSCMDLGFDVKNFTKGSYFAKEVVKTEIDPQQTWNLAKAASITVTTSSESRIKVFASNGQKDILVIDKLVSGTETINFDALDTYARLIAVNMNDGSIQETGIGGSVNFAGTKSVWPAPWGSPVKAELDYNYKQFDYQTVKSDVATPAFSDVNYSAAMFCSESGTFTLNPCWYTSESGQSATVGVYYYQNGQKVEVPIFQNDKQQDMLQYHDMWSGWQTYWDAHMPSLTGYGNFVGDYFQSRGIKVTVPANTAFGFYIYGGNDGAGHFYSEPEYNTVPYYFYAEAKAPYVADEFAKYGHIAIIDVEDRRYLAFDDWCELAPHSYTNAEYRHLVFSLSGDLKPFGSPETNTFMLACEDLGEKADYDFNDVVFAVSHVVGSTEATVKILACGGTLDNHIWYDPNVNVSGDEVDLGEIHNLFGVKLVTMINTIQGASGETRAPVYKKITVKEDFAMSATDMGGFYVRSEERTATIAAPGHGSVPYMICVPVDWKWPAEFISIVDAYPNFATWCGDHTKATDWHLNPVNDKVYPRQY
ncbi:MAG: DUF4842 domain-containing protein [Bacteroidales bacterium]|nr:DUF4842 domain-containing protein [Bacteroidales bacterium]